MSEIAIWASESDLSLVAAVFVGAASIQSNSRNVSLHSDAHMSDDSLHQRSPHWAEGVCTASPCTHDAHPYAS